MFWVHKLQLLLLESDVLNQHLPLFIYNIKTFSISVNNFQ